MGKFGLWLGTLGLAAAMAAPASAQVVIFPLSGGCGTGLGSGATTGNLGGNGPQTGLYVDTTGNLCVSNSGGGGTSSNITQLGGNAINLGNGTTGTGTMRVTLSSDSTGQVKLAAGANTIGALTAHQSVNVDQVGGASLALGQTTMSASVPVTLASDQGAVSVTPTATADPCSSGAAKLTASFSSSSSGGSIVTAVTAKKIYVCQASVVTSTAASVSFIEGTGSSVCTSGTPAGDWLNTGVTAANGAPFGANGGISAGGGNATLFYTANANYNLCVIFSTSNSPTVVASVTYVQQ